MMKIVVFILLVSIVPTTVYAEWQIPWTENGLKPSDFKGSEKQFQSNFKLNYEVSGRINWQIDGDWDIKKVDSDVCKYQIINQNLVAYFMPYTSWGNEKALQDERWLNHEQKHFDIVQIYVNQFNNDNTEYLCPNGLYDTKYIDYLVQKKFNQIQEVLQLKQDQYDIETNGGTYLIQQKLWDNKIQQWLDTRIEPVNDVWTDKLFFWMESRQITDQEFLFALEYLVEKEILE